MAQFWIVLCVVVASTLAATNRIFNDQWRVVGGKPAEKGAYPHQVSLGHSILHLCGGAIVHREWVITAAHCVNKETPSHLVILAGTNDLTKGGQTYKVLEIHYHEKYDPTTARNDVAILKTEKITFNDKVGAITVETEDVAGDEPCVLSGWGATSHPGMSTDILQDIDLKTITVEECQSKDPTGMVYDSNICTLTKKGEGACHGDSGGPLIRTVNGKTTLIGSVSVGVPCARGFPDVYARMSSFVEWFNQKCNNCLNN